MVSGADSSSASNDQHTGAESLSKYINACIGRTLLVLLDTGGQMVS
jgi:hypothetical protein